MCIRDRQELSETIERCDVEFVVSGTPIDLAALLKVRKPVLRARYEYAELEHPGLGGLLREFLRERGLLHC